MSSSSDMDVWKTIGRDTIHAFVACTVETFVTALYAVLVYKAGFILLGVNRTMAARRIFVAVFVMFGLAVSLWIIDLHNVVVEIQRTLLSDSTDSLQDIYSSALNEVLRLASVEDVLYSYMTIIGDGIIIWRVYAFWARGRERIVLIVPLAFLMGSIAASMMLTYCAARLGSDIVLGTYQDPAFCRNIQTASYSTALATTGVATALIGYKTWEYRHTHLEAFGKTSSRTRTQIVMLMLIESGVFYMLFFLVAVIMSLNSVNARINKSQVLSAAFEIYQFTSSHVVGMYPTIVVLLVNSKHSVLKANLASSGSASNNSVLSRSHRRASQTAYLHPSSSGTCAPSPAAPRTVDLYEMSRLQRAYKTEESDVKEDSVLSIGIQQSLSYDV